MTTKKISVGNYKTLSTDINGMKSFNMDFNQLCLLVGQNGTGKTLILILSWLVNTVTASWVAGKNQIPDMVKYAGYLFMKSFDRCDFTCFVEANYEELTVRIELDRGVVTSVTFTPKDPNAEFVSAGMPVFMSKETRLFTQINQYLKMKKMLNLGSVETFTEKNMDDLCEMYRIYDIMFIERMVQRVSAPNFKVDDKVWDGINSMLNGKKLQHISYDEIGCNFIIHEDKNGSVSKYHATMLSAGEQSLVNMYVNSSMS